MSDSGKTFEHETPAYEVGCCMLNIDGVGCCNNCFMFVYFALVD